ncbi:nucleotidyltransferase family protein [Marinibaculum pumilum]|uniref:Nucleotidyltransferase family protein n=1 Tax=Marinibaculum pumilum TaxID=1766165 RepID=A0ABV7KVR0_9PROT
MHAEIAAKRQAMADLCRRYGVTRLDVFGSAARGVDFDPANSDADFLVTFRPEVHADMVAFLDFKEALEQLLRRQVDLIDRRAIEASRNPIRRRNILTEAETVYG